MATATAAERNFAVFARGEMREDMLASWRNGLRGLRNPETGLPFTDLEIATATARKSRWYVEADAIDLILLAGQGNALFLADQVRIDRAASGFLHGYHGEQWQEEALAAEGGSGTVDAPANPGTFFVGSTIIGDPAAVVGVDPAGLRYQVLFSDSADGTGHAALVLVGIDTGKETNLEPGTKIKWTNGPLGATGDASVTVQFTGGTPQETDAEFASRLLSRIAHKPAAGNNAHVRAWARDASNAVEDACVYACAFNAGSVLVAVVQKRAGAVGPTARIASIGTLAKVTSYLTPPGSPVVPVPPHIVVVPCVAAPTNMVLALSMPKGRSSGWEDLTPWPVNNAGADVEITALASQTSFTIVCTTALPAGIAAPSMMAWNPLLSRFEKLTVQSVVNAGGNNYTVTLTSAPTMTLAIGSVLSPFTQRHELLAETIEAYADSLGPGEVIDLATDLRAQRAFRFPEPNEELPQRAGAGVISRLQDALGGTLADSTLASISLTTPPIPAQVILGPSLIVLGKIGLYSF
jgi:hypothetical protein